MAAKPTTNLCFWALLTIAMVVVASNVKCASAKVCPLYCITDAGYMSCPSSGAEQLEPVCNCCLAASGCKLYRADGTLICSAT